MVSWIIATGADDAAEDATDDSTLDDADEGVLDATDDIDELATLDEVAAAEDMLDALDDAVVCFESLLPPQALSATAIQAAKLSVIELRKYIHFSPKHKNVINTPRCQA